MKKLTVLLALLATPAAAQEPTFDASLTEQCVAATTDMLEKEACVGQSATQCMLDTPDGLTTPGMVACYDLELAYWRDRLAGSHDSLRARLTEWDGMKEAGDVMNVPLLDAQHTAWAAFRDADCALLLSHSGEVGEGADFMTVTCHVGHTARQAMTLEEMDREL